MVQQMTPIDEAKLHQILGQVVTDFGATMSNALVVAGDRLGLYQALASGESYSPGELAARTGTSERYIAAWLVNQASVGYLDYDLATGTYRLSPEGIMLFADEKSPVYVLGGFQLVSAVVKMAPRLAEAYKTGAGIPWGEYDSDLFAGTERFFQPGYQANLVTSWLPALEGVVEKLERGATVADVGCGHGSSSILIAQAFPKSRVVGFDSHLGSIEIARKRAQDAGVSGRVSFEVANATDYPGEGYDLIAFFDSFHDLGDPVGAATHACRALDSAGTLLLVEPMAGQRTEENFNVVGRIFSAANAAICTPNGIATGGHGLGTIATDEEIGSAVRAGGFKSFRRATETPFNRIFEVRT